MKGLEKQIEIRTKDIRSIMSSIHQGILVLENRRGSACRRQVSHFATLILGCDPRGKPLKEVLFNATDLAVDSIAAAESALISTLGKDVNFVSNLHLLPAEMIFRRGQENLILEADWSFVEFEQRSAKKHPDPARL